MRGAATAAAQRRQPRRYRLGAEAMARGCGSSNLIRYHEPMVLDPAIGVLITASIALLFAGAAAHKLRDLKAFDEIFSAYGLMPAMPGVRISWLVPLLEMTVAAGLLIKVSRPYAGGLGIFLLSAYAAAIAVNLR